MMTNLTNCLENWKFFVTACDGNTYGLECKKRCGNCSDSVQCNHVTGTCPNGCNVGVFGEKCDIGNASWNYLFYKASSWNRMW